MKKRFVLVLGILMTAVSTRSAAVQSGGGGLQPWSKTCIVGSVGADACTVSVTMTNSGYASCGDDPTEYCVTVSVSCSTSGGEEDCSSGANCGVCGGGGAAAGVSCDGQCFSAQPLSSKCWNDVAGDCGNLAVRDSGHPCS
jgi:hypothetical protein